MFLSSFTPFRSFSLSPANMRSCLSALMRFIQRMTTLWVACPLVLLLPLFISAQSVFINEFHYDNTGADVNEGVEIAGPAGTDLACYMAYLYNQTDSMFYDTVNLYGIIDDEGCGYGAVWFPVAGIQNGPADAIALVNACNCGGVCDSTDVVNFLSYEGVILAKDGPAGGLQSNDMGVSEPTTLAIGNSLQLTGSGVYYQDFSWSAPSASSPGAINTGQSFGGGIVADRLSFITYPVTCSVINDTFSLTVCGTNSTGDVSNTYSGTVTLSQISGPGNLNGTLILGVASCCARFSDLTTDSAGIYTIVASDGTNLNDTLVLAFSDTCGKCFEINSILVEACEPVPGTEGANEMVRFTVGPDDLDVNDLYVIWPNNGWLGVCQDSVTAAIVDSINNMITYDGSVSEPVNGIIPAGATVILVTSTNFDWDSHDWTYLNYDIYMIFQCAGNLQGHFKNNEGCPCGDRTLIMTFAGACSDTVTYTVDSLPNGGNGGDGDAVVYDAAGNPQYGNNQCLPPIFPFTLNLFMAAQPVSCNGVCDGIASVFHTGGVKPYTYLWNDPASQTDSLATGLCAGIYTITVTDWLGTTAVDSVTITEPDSLTAIITSITDVSCYGDSTGGALVVAAGGSGSYSYMWNTGAATSSINLLPSSIYTVTVTDYSGCTATAAATITEPPPLIVAIDSIKNVACSGDSNGYASVSATGGIPGYSFTWSTGGTGIFIAGLPGGIYSVTVTDTNGCTSSTPVSVAEPTPLASAIISKTDVSCNGYCDGTATVIAGGGTLPYSYLWDNLSDSSLVTALCQGIHSITITDGNGCQVTNSVTISEPQLIQFVMIVTNISCNGSCDGMITLLPGPTGGTPFYTYTWVPNIGTGPTITNLCAGDYAITVTDIKGCTASDSASVTEPSPFIITTGSSDASCGNSDGMAWVIATGGVPPFSYQWNDPASQTTDTAFNLSAGAYQVVILDSSGCTDSINITVNNLGALVISIDNIINVSCYGLSDGGIYITVSSGTPPFTYGWSNSSWLEDLVGISGGIYTVTVTDSLGCISNTDTVIYEPTAISAISYGDTIICISQTVTIGVTVTGGVNPYTYVWDNGIPNVSTYNVSPLVTTTYTVIAIDANGCSAPAQSVTITVSSSLVVTVNGNNVVCEDSAAILTASGSGGDGGPYSYLWSTGQTMNPHTVYPLATTIYTVTISDNCGSPPATDSITVSVQQVLILLPADTNGCQGDTFSLTASGAITYWWSNTATPYDTVELGPTLIVSPSVTSSYLIHSFDGLCQSIDTVTVTVHPLPVAAFSSDITSGCWPITVQYYDSSGISGGTITNWIWIFDIGTAQILTFSQNPLMDYNIPGVFPVFLEVTSDRGCKDTIAIPDYISIFPYPYADFTATPQVTFISDPDIAFINTSQLAISFEWNFGDGDTSMAQNPVHHYSDTGTFTVILTVSSQDGCMDTVIRQVIIFVETIQSIDSTLKIPTSFSPNGDGVNETWILRGIENYPAVLVEIFNRWGSKIFSSKGYSIPWDGTYNGNKVPPATYYYIISPGMDKEPVTGTVTVVW